MKWGNDYHRPYLHNNSYYYEDIGYWKDTTGYVAIRYLTPTDTLYGWLHLSTTPTITLMEYALEGE